LKLIEINFCHNLLKFSIHKNSCFFYGRWYWRDASLTEISYGFLMKNKAKIIWLQCCNLFDIILVFHTTNFKSHIFVIPAKAGIFLFFIHFSIGSPPLEELE